MRRSWLLSATALLGASCAWSNPANRPVWNTFENNLVPDDATARLLTLPLTVPLGLLAVLTDTLVAHPLQVVDDAALDAGELWEDLDWDEHYYTEFGLLPWRVVGTPVTFVASWLGRSIFDIDSARPKQLEAPAADDPTQPTDPAADRTALLEYFAALARRQRTSPPDRAPQSWDAEMQDAFALALAESGARGRLQLFRFASRHELEPLRRDPWLGLRDPDPVVRYLELTRLGKHVKLPDELRAALLADSCEAVRELATERFDDGK